MAYVGQKKGFTVTITNKQLCTILGMDAADLTFAIIKKSLEKELGAKVAASLVGWEVAPGVVIAAMASIAIGLLNNVMGNDGFKFTFTMVYIETYMHKEGQYYYGWDFDDVSASTY